MPTDDVPAVGSTGLFADIICDKCGTRRGSMTVVKLESGLIGNVCGECKRRHGNTFRGRPGWVYVIGHGEYWKCGITTRCPERRLADMQNGNPHHLEILKAWMVGDCGLGESLAHKKLSALHYRGEWFNGTKEEIMNALIPANPKDQPPL